MCWGGGGVVDDLEVVGVIGMEGGWVLEVVGVVGMVWVVGR